MTIALRPRPQERAGDAAGHTDDSRELARFLAECAASGAARSALVLRLSLLPRERAQPQHLRLARAALEPLRSAERARLFSLDNHDVVAVWRGDAAQLVSACLGEIDHLFADDDDTPAGSRGGRPADLVASFLLPRDASALLDIVETSLDRPTHPLAPGREPRRELDLASLAVLEERLLHADIASFARRTAVCTPAANGDMMLAWELRYPCIAALMATLAPDLAPGAQVWLDRRLSRALDRRMLALLSDPEELRRAGPFSLQLNVASLLSAEFLRFDAALPGRLRGRIVLELRPEDAVADPAAFLFAREFLHVRGYRLLLRGMTPALLRVFPLATAGVDLLQMPWTPALATLSDPLRRTDPARVVLGAAHSRGALDWGRSLGIVLYQGIEATPGSARP